MKIPKIAKSVGQIDDDLVVAATAPVRAPRRSFIKWAIPVTAVVALVLIVASVLPMLLGGEDRPPVDLMPAGLDLSLGDLDRNYKDVALMGAESARDWPAEYMTVEEKHRTVIWALREYSCSGRTVDQAFLGSKLGKYLGFEVYSLAGMPEKRLIAIGLEGNYYVYRGDFSEKPDTLGELNDTYHLTDILRLSRFSTYEDGREKQYYALADDGYVMQVLASCRDAAVVQNSDGWSTAGKDYLSFTVTSDLLGVYKRAMYITADGYLWTNAFDYAYVYEIGTDAAQRIIAYATENGTPKEPEPYEYSLAGTLVKIEDGYAYIDDSVMCVDESEGMVFRVSTSDMRIRRCLAELEGKEGTLVVVTFRGGIDTQNGNLILGARSISGGILIEGDDVIVPE